MPRKTEHTTDFGLTEDRKNELINSGRDSTVKYFEWWNGISSDIAANHTYPTD